MTTSNPQAAAGPAPNLGARATTRCSRTTTRAASTSRTSGGGGSTRFLKIVLVLMAALSFNGALCFQYDIWFKYPHPYTQSEPALYCSEQVAGQVRNACHSALPVYVNTLDSPKTLIPYTIGQLLDFCELREAREYEHSQHTEWDDNIRLAPFDLRFQRPEECRMLCARRQYRLSVAADLYRLEELKLGLTRDYYHHWFADTLPFSWCYKQSPATSGAGSALALNSNTRNKECFIGFPLGYTTDERGLPEDERVPLANFTKPNAMFLFNHFDISVFYESGEGKLWAGKLGAQAARITALRIIPRSIDHEAASTGAQGASKCSFNQPQLEIPSQLHYGLNQTVGVSYSYSVRYLEDEPGASWPQRWQRLEATLPGTARGKWILSFAILLLLATGLPAAYALARTIYSDHQLVWVNPRDQVQEATWRLLASDIFREPLHIGLFSVLVGSGCQFIASVVLSELFSTFISLFSTSLLVVAVALFVVVHGFVGGFAATRLYRTFGGDHWRLICLFVTLLNPLVIFCLLVMSRNLLLLYNGSLMALNIGLFGSLFMATICFAFSLPSALAGGNIAFKMAAIEFPVRPGANKRDLPEHKELWKQPLATTLATGLVPLFCYWAVESYPFYDSGGYVITVITILIVICLSLTHCYYHLAHADYRWWWRSYLACALAAAYYFLHCCYYIFANLYVDTLSNALLYLAFAFFICLALFLLTGTIGFLVTFGFLWHSYARAQSSPDMNYAMFQKSNQIDQ